MTDIVIQHCRLRVVRRGGWSWGPDPQRLIQVATAALPRLLEEALSHLLENVYTDLHIENLSVRLGPAAAAVVANPLGPPSPAAVDALRAAIVRQLRPQLPHVASTVVEHPAEVLRTPELLPEIEPCDFARVIVGWYKDGSLQARLAWFSLPALQAWESALLEGLPQQSPDESGMAHELPASLRALIAEPSAQGDQPRTLLSLRLLLAAEILTAHAGDVPASSLQRLLARVLPAPPVIPSSTETARADAPGVPPPRDDQLRDPPPRGPQHPAEVPKSHPMVRPSSIRAASSPIDTRVCSALPFLVLGILHRMGYLRTLSAALAVADATPLAAAYAAALAYKLLRAPEFGWRRDPESLHAAATFAGLTAPLEEKTLRTFERQAGTHLTPLDGDIVASLRAGYDARNPLLVQREDRVYLCFDTLGMFPLAFAASFGAIESLVASFAPAVVFADAATISSPLIECLERNSCAFVTDAQPGRGDQWRPLDRRRQHWTGGSRPASAALRGRYLTSTAEGRQFVEHFIRERPAIAGRPSESSEETSLDRRVTVAAGAGLAQLAYTLWREREPTSAVLAYQRFHDLEGRIQIDAERIRVRLALGRRFLDLREHGLLRDIAGVPWWGARTLQFAEP